MDQRKYYDSDMRLDSMSEYNCNGDLYSTTVYRRSGKQKSRNRFSSNGMLLENKSKYRRSKRFKPELNFVPINSISVEYPLKVSASVAQLIVGSDIGYGLGNLSFVATPEIGVNGARFSAGLGVFYPFCQVRGSIMGLMKDPEGKRMNALEKGTYLGAEIELLPILAVTRFGAIYPVHAGADKPEWTFTWSVGIPIMAIYSFINSGMW